MAPKRQPREPAYPSLRAFVEAVWGDVLQGVDSRTTLEAAFCTMSPGNCLDINIHDGLPGFGLRKPHPGENVRIGFHGTYAEHLAQIRKDGFLKIFPHKENTYGHFDCVFTSRDYWTADYYTMNKFSQRDQLFPGFFGSVVLLGVSDLALKAPDFFTCHQKVPERGHLKPRKKDTDAHGRERNEQEFYFQEGTFVLQRVLIMSHNKAPFDPDLLNNCDFKRDTKEQRNRTKQKVKDYKRKCQAYFVPTKALDELESVTMERPAWVELDPLVDLTPNPAKRKFLKKQQARRRKVRLLKNKKKKNKKKDVGKTTVGSGAASSSGY